MHSHNILRLDDIPNMRQKRNERRRVTTSLVTATDANGDPLQTTFLTTDDNGNPTTVTTDVVSTILPTSSLAISSTPSTLSTAFSSSTIAPMTSSSVSSSASATATVAATQNVAEGNAGAPSHTAQLLTTILVPCIPLAALLILIVFYIRRNARRMKEEARQSHVFSPPAALNGSSTAMSGTTVAGSGTGSTKKKWSNGSVVSSGPQMSQVAEGSSPISPPQPLFTSPSSRSLSQYSAGEPEDFEDWVCQNSPYLRPIGTPRGTPRGSPKQTPRSSMGVTQVGSSLRGGSPSSPVARYPSSIATIKLPPNRRSSQPESAAPPSPPRDRRQSAAAPVLPSAALGLEPVSTPGASSVTTAASKRSSAAASFNTASEGLHSSASSESTPTLSPRSSSRDMRPGMAM